MLMTLIVLIAAMVQTQQRKMVPWKSSALALLFYGLGGWEGEARRVVEENQRDLKEIAGGMRGKLVGSGWETTEETGERLAFRRTG